jgi:isopenicillin N synthase-like dioxygenase
MSRSLGLSKCGYEGIGEQKLDVKPDTKEGFYVGVEMDEDDAEAGCFLKGPNLWPEGLGEEGRVTFREFRGILWQI